MLRKPDAQQSAAFFFVPGQNMFFTYATNRVILNSSGGGGGPFDPLGAAHDATNGFPWLVLSDPAGSAHNSTNGFPWGVLYDPAGSAHDATNNLTIPATMLTGLAPGTNVTFTTNAGVLSINASGGGGGGSGLTTNFGIYFSDGTLNWLYFTNGSLVAISNPISPFVAAWAGRVVAHGGATVSANTQIALTVFLNALTNAGIASKMLAVNCLVPDNLIAACTPLLVGGGSDPWGNTAFVAGDLSVNGLLGNGSSKYLTTGVLASSIPGNPNSGGLTVYYYTNPNDNGVEMAATDGGTAVHQLQFYAGVITYDAYKGTTGRVTYNAPGFTGYVSGNRIAVNSEDLYIANSGTAHASVNSNTGAPVTAPNFQHYMFAWNNQPTPLYFSAKRLSFGAIHQGLTAGESLAFFNAIQALRQALGGGWT